MQKAINWYGNNFTGESRLPRSNQKVCLAKVNGQWHRAVVMKAEGNGKPIMELIDLKSVQQVRLKNIILMPHIFGRYSIMSELCVVAGYKKIKETSPEFFQELKTISVNEVSWDKKNQLITLHFQQDKNIQTLEL